MVYSRKIVGISTQKQMADLMNVSVGVVQRLEAQDNRVWDRVSLYFETIDKVLAGDVEVPK